MRKSRSAKRVIRMEFLMKAKLFADFTTMQASTDENYNLIESLNLE